MCISFRGGQEVMDKLLLAGNKPQAVTQNNEAGSIEGPGRGDSLEVEASRRSRGQETWGQGAE